MRVPRASRPVATGVLRQTSRRMLIVLGLGLATLVQPVSAAPRNEPVPGDARIDRLLPILPDGPSSTSFLSASPVSSVFGQSVTFNYVVSAGGGTPNCTNTNGGTVSLVEGGTIASAVAPAAISTTALSTGFHVLTLQYGGNANCDPSSSSPFGYTVSKASTTTALSSSLNPAGRFQNVTFTATVTSTAGTPTGVVT